MPPRLESEKLALTAEGVRGLPPQQVFLTDALTCRPVSCTHQDSPTLRIRPTCPQTRAKSRPQECIAHLQTLLRNHSLPECFRSPQALSSEPTHPPRAAVPRVVPKLSTSMTFLHMAPAGSPGTEAKLGSQQSTSPLLGPSLTVWRLAQGAHINGAAGPSWQGATQMHKNTGVYTFWLSCPADVWMERFSTASSTTQQLYVATMQRNEPPVLKKNS